MTIQQEFTCLSSDGKTVLRGMEWLPEGEPRAVVQISHGMCEHMGWYDTFARFLNEKGIAVIGHDHLGHGKSAEREGAPLYFGEGNTWQTVTEDLYVLHNRIRSRYPDTPLVLLGYSMGSFLARTYLIRYPGTVKAAILMGTAWQGSLTVEGGLLLSGLIALRGDRATSPFVTKMVFGSYNKRIKPAHTSFDWLTHDEAVMKTYMADPMCAQDVTVGMVREMLKGFKFNQKFGNLDKMSHETPILLISGQEDPVGDYGIGVQRTHLEFKRSGVRSCTAKLYPELRHNLLMEASQCPQIFDDLSAWIEENIQ